MRKFFLPYAFLSCLFFCIPFSIPLLPLFFTLLFRGKESCEGKISSIVPLPPYIVPLPPFYVIAALGQSGLGHNFLATKQIPRDGRPDPEVSSRGVGLIRRSPGRSPPGPLPEGGRPYPDPSRRSFGWTHTFHTSRTEKCQEKGTGPPVQGIFITLRWGDAGRSMN